MAHLPIGILGALVLLVSPLSFAATEPRFPPGVRYSHPFCIAGPQDTILMAYRVREMTTVELARSADAGLSWQILSSVQCHDLIHDFSGNMMQMRDDSLVMIVKDRDLRASWIRRRDGGRTWSPFTPVALDGLKWSRPFRIRRGVQDGPNLVRAHGRLVAFNQLAPPAEYPTRQIIEIPDESTWFLSPIVKPQANHPEARGSRIKTS